MSPNQKQFIINKQSKYVSRCVSVNESYKKNTNILPFDY